MRKHVFIMATAAFILSTFAALPALAEPGARGKARHQPFLTRDRTTFSLTSGVRQDDLRWNVSADEDINVTPNILSELTWENVQYLETEAKVKHISPTNSRTFRGGWQMEGNLRGGLGISGRVQDSDYAGNNRTGEFSRATADSDTGYTLGGQAAAGYRFNVAQRVKNGNYTFITLAPLVGYGVDHAQFKLEGIQVEPPPVGDPIVLDSDFNPTWYGPFIGMEAEWEHNNHMLTLRGEYHDLSYFADATWDLREDFMKDPSFEQEAEGTGQKIALQYSYAADSKYEFTIDVSHMQREMEGVGTDTIYFSNGNILTQKRLREVDHTTQAIRFGLTYGW